MAHRLSDSKSTGRALLASFLALLLCFATLLSTTFAWFTDSASTGVNTITAGNLDIEVEYLKDGSKWASLDGKADLFQTSNWEPGATDVVYLKITNKGTLAPRYKYAVNVVSEVVGTNANNKEIKLSEILKFACVYQKDMPETYDRQQAQSLASNSDNVQALNTYTADFRDIDSQNSISYYALIVYMPTDTGNEANYVTGTVPPSIDMTIDFVATQATAESDSFDSSYDENAIYPAIPSFTKAVVGGTVEDASEELVLTDVATDLTATIPANTLTKDDSVSLTVERTSLSADSVTYEISIEVNEQEKTSLENPVSVKVNIGVGLSNVVVTHNGKPMTNSTSGEDQTYNYDSESGILTIVTKSFSPFEIRYETNFAASIGNVGYETLSDAFTNVKNGDTITLQRDTTVTKLIQINGGKTVSFDLAGHTLTIVPVNHDGIEVSEGATFNLTNSVAETGKYIFDCSNAQADAIYVYNDKENITSTLNINNPVCLEVQAAANSAIHAYAPSGNAIVNIKEGTNIKVSGVSQSTAIIIDQNSTVNMSGGTFELNVDFENFSYSNDVVGAVLWGQNGTQENIAFNLTGGTFKVGGKNAFVQAIQIGEKNRYSNNVKVTIDGGDIVLSPTEAGMGYAFTAVQGKYGTFVINNANVSGTLNDIAAEQYGNKVDLTIYGGTFLINPSGYLAEGRIATENNGIWTVSEDN